jgi:universal stress protein A
MNLSSPHNSRIFAMKTKAKPVSKSAKIQPHRSAVRATKRSTRTSTEPGVLGLRSILVPVDFSSESKKALRYAVSLARQYGAKLTLVNVVERTGFPDFATYPLTMEDDKVMKSARGRLELLSKQEGLEPKLIEKLLVRQGVPFHEITEAARTLLVDLIVITTHGYTGWKHALIGSTAERVVRHAPCPVLSVREIERDFLPSTKPK